jgi:hypothetical protein
VDRYAFERAAPALAIVALHRDIFFGDCAWITRYPETRSRSRE